MKRSQKMTDMEVDLKMRVTVLMLLEVYLSNKQQHPELSSNELIAHTLGRVVAHAFRNEVVEAAEVEKFRAELAPFAILLRVFDQWEPRARADLVTNRAIVDAFWQCVKASGEAKMSLQVLSPKTIA